MYYRKNLIKGVCFMRFDFCQYQLAPQGALLSG